MSFKKAVFVQSPAPALYMGLGVIHVKIDGRWFNPVAVFPDLIDDNKIRGFHPVNTVVHG